MATLDLEINCMCLFATDEQAGTVHVLMPATHDHGHDDQHVVRLFHRSFPDQQEGVSMEGWSLELGAKPGEGEAGTAVKPPAVDASGVAKGEIVDLSTVTDRTVSRTLAGADVYPDDLAARITLFHGSVAGREDEGTTWLLNETERVMAHKVVWRIENIPERLSWVDLGAGGSEPLASLADLEPEADGSYRLEVHHVTRKSLPPIELGQLDEKAVRHHFGAFYKLLEFQPADLHLPKYVKGGEGGKYNCKTAQADMV